MTEIYALCLTVLVIGTFWVHRKYPKTAPPLPPELDTQQFMKDFIRFKEEFKAFKLNYTGSEIIFGANYERGPNGDV